MALLAKRVSALVSEPRMASTSVTPCARAASTTWPKMVSALSGIGAPDFDLVETRRAGSVAGAHHLLGLAFAAIGNAPQRPVLGSRDGRAGVPELGRDAAVAGVLQHADALAVTHLPGDFAAELEIVALVVDGPTPIGLHVDGLVCAHHFVERLLTRQQAHVGHADERYSGPAVGPHAAVGTRLAHHGRGLARGHVAHELAGANDIGRLRRHAFIVESESAETGAMIKARVADHVDNIRAVAQVVELVECEKARAGVVGFAAEDAVELDGMADGFVNLQAELRAIEDQVKLTFRALRGGVQRHGFFGDARGMAQQVELSHQLVAFQLVLAADGVGERALLDFAVLVAESGEARAAGGAGLIDQAAESGSEDLPLPYKAHGGFRQADGGIAAQLGVYG